MTYLNNVTQGTINCFISPENAIKRISDYLETGTKRDLSIGMCMDILWGHTKRLKMVYGFKAMAFWYRKAIEEFNSTFKNIQIEISWEKEIWFKRYSSWEVQDGHIYYHECEKPNEINGQVKHYSSVLTVTLSEKYEEKNWEYLHYIIHHFIQMLSVSNGYIDVLTKDPNENYIDYIIKYCNEKKFPFGAKGMSLYDYDYKTEYFLTLDNINLINSSKFTGKQDAILDTVANLYLSQFDENFGKKLVRECLVIGRKNSSSRYCLTTYNALMKFNGGDIYKIVFTHGEIKENYSSGRNYNNYLTIIDEIINRTAGSRTAYEVSLTYFFEITKEEWENLKSIHSNKGNAAFMEKLEELETIYDDKIKKGERKEFYEQV